MAKLVSNASDIPPRLVGNALFRLIPEPGSSFADDLQFALDRRNCHGIRAKRLEIHAGREFFDHRDRFHDVAEPPLWRRTKRQEPTRAPLFPAPRGGASFYRTGLPSRRGYP